MKTFLILAFIFFVVLEVVTRTPKATTAEKPQLIQVPTKVEERVNILWEERQASMEARSAYAKALTAKMNGLTNGAIFISGRAELNNVCRVRVTGVTNGIVFHHFIFSSRESTIEQRDPVGYFLDYMTHE